MENREEHLTVVKEVMRPLEFTVRQSDCFRGLIPCRVWVPAWGRGPTHEHGKRPWPVNKVGFQFFTGTPP